MVDETPIGHIRRCSTCHWIIVAVVVAMVVIVAIAVLA